MTTVSDIALSQLNVLDSSMAYREAGSQGDPVALFLHDADLEGDVFGDDW
jgi:haloalkane dehalogenase